MVIERSMLLRPTLITPGCQNVSKDSMLVVVTHEEETSMGISPDIKSLLGFTPDTPDAEVNAEWEKRIGHVCKPCWELKYCPYGPLVEQFPLLGLTRKEAVQHNRFLRKRIAQGSHDDNIKKKKMFEKEIGEFEPAAYPVKHSKTDLEKECKVFGHLCPVFFTNEPLTETHEMRRITRRISRTTMLRVIRRDASTYQICGRHLQDSEIEFDHKIPWSRGGTSDENNISVTCRDCNRHKGTKRH